MGKTYFVFDEAKRRGFEAHWARTHQEGIAHENLADIPEEQQSVTTYDQHGNPTTRSRMRKPDASIGLDSGDVHMSGDPCVVTREEADPRSGDINMYVTRYSTSGRRLGDYVVPWVKMADGRHVKGTPRRTTN